MVRSEGIDFYLSLLAENSNVPQPMRDRRNGFRSRTPALVVRLLGSKEIKMSLYIKSAFNNVLLAGTNEIAFRIVYYHIFKKYSN